MPGRGVTAMAPWMWTVIGVLVIIILVIVVLQLI
jgi:hypothetical protein